MKLFKLAWDMVGSEFAGRHLQYEKFYAGASFIIRNHSFRETDWAEFNKLVEDDKLAAQFATYWQTPQGDAVTRMKLFRLAWDMVGSEFAGRHLQYEKFYAGASFIIRNHSFRETDWAAFNKLVDDLMAGYDVPTRATGKAAAE